MEFLLQKCVIQERLLQHFDNFFVEVLFVGHGNFEKFLQKLVRDRFVGDLQDFVSPFSGLLTDEKLGGTALKDFHQLLGVVNVTVTYVVDELKN